MRLIDIIYGCALFLILGGCLLADGLADLPHGFLILFIIVGAGGALVLIGNKLEEVYWRRRK